jgi:uncharacterized membrane protein YidH (DUF202 family)
MESYRELGSRGVPSVVTTDLDSFLTGVYRYWSERGLRSVLLQSISNLVASVFTFVVCFVLLFLVDWYGVITCSDATSCVGVTLFYSDPFGRKTMSFVRFLIFIQLVLLGLYTVVLAGLSCVAKAREAVKISHFFHSGLNIPDDAELAFIPWESIVERIEIYQRTAVPPLCIVQDELSALEITNVIMRGENMLLAIMKKFSRFIDVRRGNFSKFDNFLSESVVGSATVQWLLQFGVIAWAVSERYTVRADVVDVETIRNRLKLIGLVSSVFIFPIFIFGAILLFIQESARLKSGGTLSEPEWTSSGKTQLRHFSEMEHVFKQRLSQGKPALCKLVSASFTQNDLKKNIVKILIFVTSGLLAVLAIIGVVQDKAIMYLEFAGHNLFFYFAILSVGFGVLIRIEGNSVRSVVVKDTIRASVDFSVHAHTVLVSEGYVRGTQNWSEFTKSKILQTCPVHFGRNKLFIFLNELVSILAVPYVFYRHLIHMNFPELFVQFLSEGVYHSGALGDFAKGGVLVEDQGREVEMGETSVGGSNLNILHPELAQAVLAFHSKFPAGCVWNREQVNLIERVTRFREFFLRESSRQDLKMDSIQSLNFWYVFLMDVISRSGPVSTLQLDEELWRIATIVMESEFASPKHNFTSIEDPETNFSLA